MRLDWGIRCYNLFSSKRQIYKFSRINSFHSIHSFFFETISGTPVFRFKPMLILSQKKNNRNIERIEEFTNDPNDSSRHLFQQNLSVNRERWEASSHIIVSTGQESTNLGKSM